MKTPWLGSLDLTDHLPWAGECGSIDRLTDVDTMPLCK